MKNPSTDHRSDPLVPVASVRPWLDRLQNPIAVTGGTGFVGSHLVDTLCDAGRRPRVLVRDRSAPRWIGARGVDWVSGSLADRDALRALVDGAGTVIHLAGVVRAVRTEEFERANRGGTARLVLAIRDAAPSARLVHVSSLSAVGPSAVPGGVSPDAKPHPISDYGRSKLAAEIEVRGVTGVADWTIIRPPTIYGPRDTDVFQFFRMARAGLVLMPGGDRWITVSFVVDVVRGILAAAAADPGQIFHLGEPEPYRLADLVKTLAKAGRVSAQALPVPTAAVRTVGLSGGVLGRLGVRRIAMTPDKAREMVARHWTADTGGSLAALGIAPVTRFADGAHETWAWYRKQRWLG
jgi:nucleoside-diphosphate-sugar epimerase